MALPTPQSKPALWQSLQAWFRRSLANQLATLTMAVSAFVVLSIAIASIWIAFLAIQKKEVELLQKDLAIAGSRLSIELNNIIDELDALANNPVLINSLADNEGAKAYLPTFLNDFRFRQIGAVALTVNDYRGRPLAANRPEFLDSATASELVKMADGQPSAAKIVQLEGRWQLLLAHAIKYPDSNASQGFVIADIPLDLILATWLAPDRDPRTWSLQFSHNGAQANTRLVPTASTEVLALTAALTVKEPLMNLNLVLQMHEADRGAIQALQYLLPIFLILVLLALVAAWLLSWQLGKRLAKPIVALADRARAVTQTRQFTQALAVTGSDETAQLTRDFNAMLAQLQQLQTQLERTAHIRGARLVTIFELSPDGFVEMDAEGNIVYLNPAFTALTGIALTQLPNPNWQALAAQLDQQLAQDEQSVQRLGEAQEDALHQRERIVRLHTPSLKSLGVARRKSEDGDIILYWRDLTREAEMNAMKSAFLSKAAHELRTPLTSILGFTELLGKDQSASQRQRDIVAIMLRQGRNLLQLIHDLLDLARLEVQSTQWQRQTPQSLVALTQLIVSEFQMPGEERQRIFALEEHLPEVRIDANAYRQVLTNLLSNAMKYSPSGSPIRIASRTEQRDGIAWQGIAVEDRGMGMNPKELEQVGQRFYRANPQGGVSGTGLGLSVVHEIMELHRGRVEYASQSEHGTTVTVWFPQSASQDLPSDPR
jgi:PAS domain S-box-containing protein